MNPFISKPLAIDWGPPVAYPAFIIEHGELVLPDWGNDMVPTKEAAEELVRARLRQRYLKGEMAPFASALGAPYLKGRQVVMIPTEGWNRMEEEIPE